MCTHSSETVPGQESMSSVTPEIILCRQQLYVLQAREMFQECIISINKGQGVKL